MTEQQPETPMGGCLLRMFWTMLGPVMVLIVGLVLVLHHPRLGSALDLVFAVAVTITLAARLLDRQKPGASAAEPADAPAASPTKYAVVLLVIAGALSAFAHFVTPKIF